MEHFLQRGGTLHGGTSQEDITNKVLASGQCTHEVDGIAETMERDLNLKQVCFRFHFYLVFPR